MSSPYAPNRPSPDGFDQAARAARDPREALDAAGAFDDDDDPLAPRVDLGQALDLSAERPAGLARSQRGPGAWVAALVVSSLVLAGAIMVVRDGDDEPMRREPAVPPVSEAQPAPAPVEVPAAAPAPARPVAPSRMAAHRGSDAIARSPAPVGPPAPVEITPAAIAPAKPGRIEDPHAPALPVAPPVALAPSPTAGGHASGLALPAPELDEPSSLPSDEVILPGLEEGEALDEPLPEPPDLTPQGADASSDAGTPALEVGPDLDAAVLGIVRPRA